MRVAFLSHLCLIGAGAIKHWGQPRFAGKVVLVTGGDSGIGLAAVEAFFYECANVMMVGHNVEKTKEAAHNLTMSSPGPDCKEKPSLSFLAVDIANETAVTDMMARTVSLFGRVDIAVNNAGSTGGATVQIGEPGFVEYFESNPAISVNVGGTLKCMNAQIRHWLDRKAPGVIVNVASICGESAVCGPAYTTSKWAMIGFSKQASLKYAADGIRINVLAPGAVNTPMLRDGLPESDPRWIARKQHLESAIPSKHIAEPWEMAGPITFLSSDMSSYLYGHVLTADGGVLMGSSLGNHGELEQSGVLSSLSARQSVSQQEMLV